MDHCRGRRYGCEEKRIEKSHRLVRGQAGIQGCPGEKGQQQGQREESILLYITQGESCTHLLNYDIFSVDVIREHFSSIFIEREQNAELYEGLYVSANDRQRILL